MEGGKREGEGGGVGEEGRGGEGGGGVVTVLARAVIFHLPSHNDHFFTPKHFHSSLLHRPDYIYTHHAYSAGLKPTKIGV
jgi:hypothetical protein